MRSALVLGATGLIGGHLTRLLLEEAAYDRVSILVRKPLDLAHPKLEQHRVDFDQLEQYRDLFGADDLFCCLGTTMRRARSREAFRRVDFGYPLVAARLAKESGVKRYLLVTAMGADSRSSIFYNRVKGEAEEAIAAVGLPSFLIFRPSLLLGERQEFRFGESVAGAVSRVISPLMLGPLARVRPIAGRTVARAMMRAALNETAGNHQYLSDEIARLGE